MKSAPTILNMPMLALTFLLTQSIFPNPPPTNAPDPHLIVIADYRFNGDGTDASGHSQDFVLRNTRFENETLYVDGRYEHGGGGYRAVVTVPDLDYDSFTISMEFMPTDSVGRGNVFTRFFGFRVGDESNIVTAGTSYRWLSIERNPDDSLMVSLNNGDFSHHFTNAFVNVGGWNHIVCSVNFEGSVIRTFLNAQKLEDIVLSPEFVFRVLESNKVDEEREFTLTNYSHGGTFRGYVDNLRVYSKSLDDTSALALIPEHPPGVQKRTELIKWVSYGVVLSAFGLVMFLVLRWQQGREEVA